MEKLDNSWYIWLADDWSFLSFMLWRPFSFNDSSKYFELIVFGYIIMKTIKINSLFLGLHVKPNNVFMFILYIIVKVVKTWYLFIIQ